MVTIHAGRKEKPEPATRSCVHARLQSPYPRSTADGALGTRSIRATAALIGIARIALTFGAWVTPRPIRTHAVLVCRILVAASAQTRAYASKVYLLGQCRALKIWTKCPCLGPRRTCKRFSCTQPIAHHGSLPSAVLSHVAHTKAVEIAWQIRIVDGVA